MGTAISSGCRIWLLRVSIVLKGQATFSNYIRFSLGNSTDSHIIEKRDNNIVLVELSF